MSFPRKLVGVVCPVQLPYLAWDWAWIEPNVTTIRTDHMGPGSGDTKKPITLVGVENLPRRTADDAALDVLDPDALISVYRSASDREMDPNSLSLVPSPDVGEIVVVRPYDQCASSSCRVSTYTFMTLLAGNGCEVLRRVSERQGHG